MANAEGLEYLARVFAALAAAARKGGDAGEGVHLPRLTHPVNTRLSDDLDFRFVPLTDENRRAMFKQHGVDMKSKQRGSLFDRYQETLSQFGRLQAQMRREDWMAAQATRRDDQPRCETPFGRRYCGKNLFGLRPRYNIQRVRPTHKYICKPRDQECESW